MAVATWGVAVATWGVAVATWGVAVATWGVAVASLVSVIAHSKGPNKIEVFRDQSDVFSNLFKSSR